MILSGKKLKIREGGRKPNRGKREKYIKKRSRVERERVSQKTSATSAGIATFSTNYLPHNV